MSDGHKYKVEDYLQYTPLTSLVPVRSLVKSFTAPKVEAPLPPLSDDHPSISCSTEERSVLLEQILQRAKRNHGTITFKDDFASNVRPVDEQLAPLHSQVAAAVDKYRQMTAELSLQTRAQAMPFQTPAHDTPTVSSPRHDAGQISMTPAEHSQALSNMPNNGHYHQGSTPKMTQHMAAFASHQDSQSHTHHLVPSTPDGHSMAYPSSSVAVPSIARHQMSDRTLPEPISPSPERHRMPMKLSPGKRQTTDLSLPETPSKSKRSRTGKSMSPSASRRAPVKAVTDALMIDLKSEQAASIEVLQAFLQEIFEAEDALVEDTSANSGQSHSILFDLDMPEKCLSSNAVQRLLTLLRKTSHIEALTSVSGDDLVRVQRILVKSVMINYTAQIEVVEGGVDGDEKQHSWSQVMGGALSAMYASLCITYILSGKHEDGNVYAEETLAAVVDNLKSIIEDLYLRWFNLICQSKLTFDSDKRPILDALLQACNLVLLRVAKGFRQMPVNDSITSRMVFMSVAIIFAETPPKTNPVCSALIIENLKLSSMSMLQCIYAEFHSQRTFVLDEVLSNLSKLPISRQGARQYKLADGKNIQLVTALLLHLVQTSTLITSDRPAPPTLEGTMPKAGEIQAPISSGAKEDPQESEISNALQVYSQKITSANQTAKYIINFLLERSMKNAKSSSSEDASFKVLVDGFIEDFSAVLHLPEWPGAELMLRWITNSMIRLVDNPKQGAQVKVSAVDALCNVACKIRSMILLLRKPIDPASDDLSKSLSGLPTLQFSSSITSAQICELTETQMLVFTGIHNYSQRDPVFCASLEYLVSNWIQILLTLALQSDMQASSDLRSALMNSASAISQRHQSQDSVIWKTRFDTPVTEASIRRAYLHGLSFTGIFQMFDAILPRLFAMMDHAQTTLRTKTLRSFGHLSDVDPTILSLKQVQAQVALRLSDSSPQVRDVSIDLLGRFISANPQASTEYYPMLRERLMDTGLSVRKRVLKLLKDLYMNNDIVALRVEIATQLLHCLHDEEDSVQELAYKSFESLWFDLEGLVVDQEIKLSSLTPALQRDIKGRAEIIATLAADRSAAVPTALEQLLSELAQTQSERQSLTLAILQLFGQTFSEAVVEGVDELRRLQSLIGMRTLAQAVPKIFAAGQMESLLPYLQHGPTKFEQNAPLYVASIYSSVLPHLPSQNNQFLSAVQSSILAQLTKLPVRTLNEAVPALCSATHLLKDFTRLSKTLNSCLGRLASIDLEAETQDLAKCKQAILLLHLIGLFGRHLQAHDATVLKESFKVESWTAYVQNLVDRTVSFLRSPQESAMTSVSKAALQSIGNIAITNPDVFQYPKVLKYIDEVINSPSPEAKRIVMQIFSEYLVLEQRRTDTSTKEKSKEKSHTSKASQKSRKKRTIEDVDVDILTGNTDKFATDGISPSLMQRYLKQILTSCLGLDLALALAATELVGSIVGQGLANPRNCMPTIIALETSSVAQLRELSTKMHRLLHEKHESLIDSCYIEGVKLAYRYQMRLNRNQVILEPETACLEPLYSIARSSRKGRQKFLVALTRCLDINLEKLDGLMETDVKFAQFIAHNIACLAYTTNEEVHIVIHTIDKILSTTGASVIQSFESGEEIKGQSMEQIGKAAAIAAYNMSIRSQLKLVYNISEAKCLSFDPSKLGSRSEAKAAIRQAGVVLVPDWSQINAPATTQQRRAYLLALYARDEHLLHTRRDSSDESAEEKPAYPELMSNGATTDVQPHGITKINDLLN